jgi:sugar lactone lactonase YvrE
MQQLTESIHWYFPVDNRSRRRSRVLSGAARAVFFGLTIGWTGWAAAPGLQAQTRTAGAPAASFAQVTTLVGTGEKGFSGDGGPASAARLNNPFGVARGPDGALYICDMDNDRIRRVTAEGVISTYVGSGRRGYAGDGGPAVSAELNQPYEMAWDAEQNLYFVEIGNHVVRRVDARSGIIHTVAGTGQPGFSGDGGPAKAAQMNQPHSLAFDSAGALLVCDILNHRVRKIDLRSGTIDTFAGTGEKKTAPSGSPIAGSPLHGPRALALADDGTLWLALREGNRLLKLDVHAGVLEVVAGTGQSGFTGNGGPALQATLSGPKGVSLDATGNVYLADTESHSIRMLDRARGTLELLAGTGLKGDGPDGPPLGCALGRPHGVFVDRDGSVLIGDSENHRVRVLGK